MKPRRRAPAAGPAGMPPADVDSQRRPPEDVEPHRRATGGAPAGTEPADVAPRRRTPAPEPAGAEPADAEPRRRAGAAGRGRAAEPDIEPRRRTSVAAATAAEVAPDVEAPRQRAERAPRERAAGGGGVDLSSRAAVEAWLERSAEPSARNLRPPRIRRNPFRLRSRRRRRGSRRTTALLTVPRLALLVAFAAVVGLGTGLGSRGESDDAPIATAGAGFELRRPADWSPGGSRPEVAGLPAARRSLTLAGPDGAGFLVQRVPRPFGRAVSLGLAGRLGAPEVQRSSAVLDSALTGYRWTGELAPGRRVQLYAFPLQGETVLATCHAPLGDGAQDALAACAGIVASLTTGGEPLGEIRPEREYATGLTAALAAARAALDNGGDRLRGANSPQAQSARADDLSKAVGTAADRLDALEPPAVAATYHDATRAAVRDIAAGFGDLADAARSEDRDAHGAARAAIVAGEARVEKGLAALRAIGYGAGAAPR